MVVMPRSPLLNGFVLVWALLSAEVVVGQTYEGRLCARNDPEELPGSRFTASHPLWTCGYDGLGCVDDPNNEDPLVGICAACETAADCGGRDCVNGTCQLGTIPVVTEALVPKRFLLTASFVGSWVEGSSLSDAEFDPGVGALFEIGLSRSKVDTLPDGSQRHDIPSTPAVHLSGSWVSSRGQNLYHEAGIVWRLGGVVSRIGVSYAGQAFSSSEFFDNPGYRAGVSAHFEIKHNVIVKGGYLSGSEGSTATFGVQYTRGLFDDFRSSASRRPP